MAHARHVVAAHARWLGADPHAVALAVSEAFTNAVVHAYADAGGDVEVTAHRHPARLEVCVSDRGYGISPSDQTGPWCGLGLNMIDRVTGSLEVQRRPEGGTLLRMTFPLE